MDALFASPPRRGSANATMGQGASSALAGRLGLASDTAFVAERQHETARGIVVFRERQTCQGIPVHGRSVVLERDAREAVLSVTGSAERHIAAQLASGRARVSAHADEGAMRSKF